MSEEGQRADRHAPLPLPPQVGGGKAVRVRPAAPTRASAHKAPPPPPFSIRACARLAVREDGSVVTLHGALNHGARRRLKNVALPGRPVVHLSEQGGGRGGQLSAGRYEKEGQTKGGRGGT